MTLLPLSIAEEEVEVAGKKDEVSETILRGAEFCCTISEVGGDAWS